MLLAAHQPAPARARQDLHGCGNVKTVTLDAANGVAADRKTEGDLDLVSALDYKRGRYHICDRQLHR